MSKNITLIGMPGSGKSTYGVVLAKKLGFGFIDSDLLIQDKNDMLLWEIIEAKGLDGFKKIEEEVNASIESDRCVIAPGGSVIYGKKAMEHFKQIGLVVYLNQPFEKIKSNVGDLSSRGVAMENGQTLEDLYQERTPLYESYADIIVDCKDKNGSQIVEEIYNAIKKKLS